jgi:N-acetylgalactosamine-6-sulfatase
MRPTRGGPQSRLRIGGTASWRLPFIARWPGQVPAGRIDDTSVVAGVDFLPTLCQVGAAQRPTGLKLDAEDVSDILRGKSRPRTTPLMWEWRFRIAGEVMHHSPMLAIRDGDWTLLLNRDRSRVELYDIPRDPTLLRNLAEKHPEIVDRLAKQVVAWQKTLPAGPVDPAAGKNDYPWPGRKPAR